MNVDNVILYSNVLCRFGDVWALNIQHDPQQFLRDISEFDDSWVKYNPRKNINRQGLSITSLNGDLSGVPDLDSLKEYSKEQNKLFTEADFVTPTPVYPAASRWLEGLKNNICRTHLIKLGPGGFFPMHRDNNHDGIDTFRLLIPIKNCNPPSTFFILNKQPIYFDHGRIYFVDTCLEHVLFNASFDDSIMMVVNVFINKDSVDFVLNHKQIT